MDTMKRDYIAPDLPVEQASVTMPLASSEIRIANTGIDYGGVDTEGTLDPSVKEDFFIFVWE